MAKLELEKLEKITTKENETTTEPTKENETKKTKVKMDVIKTCQYEKYDEVMEIVPKFRKITGWLTAGDVITVSPELADELIASEIATKCE